VSQGKGLDWLGDLFAAVAVFVDLDAGFGKDDLDQAGVRAFDDTGAESTGKFMLR
jgi:hypothetical protein